MKEQWEKDAKRMSINRANETLEETKKQQQMEAERANINRANESPEKSNELRQMMAERASINRATESPEKSNERQQMEAERANINRANESPDKSNEQKETNAKRMKINRFNKRVNQSPEKAKERNEKQSPEKAKEQKEKVAERVRKYWLNKKTLQEARKERMRKQVMKSVNQAPPPDQGINPEDVPNISQYVKTRESIILAYEHLMKTELKANEKFEVAPSRPGINFPLAGMCHQANVCVCCDRFTTRTSEIKWINKTVLLIHEKRLQDSDLSCLLQNCYNVLDPGLQHCLLLPRARVNANDEYTCCTQCSDSLRPHMREKPPLKFAISNKWAIGNMPPKILDLVTEVTGPLTGPVHPFVYVMSFTGGAHKSITGSNTFFGNNIEENMGELGHHVGLTGSSAVYVVMSG
jgi:hypothetical protein